MSNQRSKDVKIKPEVLAINNDGPPKKIHQSIRLIKESSVINQSIKQYTQDCQKPITSTGYGTTSIPKKHQCSGEGWWVKPVDSPYVEAVWVPKCTAKTRSREPIPNPPKFFYISGDEE